MSSSLGQIFRVTTFGESHGPAIGVVIDGCPSGIPIDMLAVNAELARRRPGQSTITTQRKERDAVEWLSGMYQGKTLGSPICFLVRNTDQRSKDYAQWEHVFRPSHADFTYHMKYAHRDPRGGGRASARETIGRVAAGAIAKQILARELNLQIIAYVEQIGNICLQQKDDKFGYLVNSRSVEESMVRCPDAKVSQQMIDLIREAQKAGDSLGGVIRTIVHNVPPGLGEPVFDKLEAKMAQACLSIPACKGFEVGSGFLASAHSGSQQNDSFYTDASTQKGNANRELKTDAELKTKLTNKWQLWPHVKTKSNHSGGIQGGISNGMPILLRLAFKPTATIHRHQDTVNTQGHSESLRPGGRHDPCVLPRAVPIVEAMIALILIDSYLLQRAADPSWYEAVQAHVNKSK